MTWIQNADRVLDLKRDEQLKKFDQQLDRLEEEINSKDGNSVKVLKQFKGIPYEESIPYERSDEFYIDKHEVDKINSHKERLSEEINKKKRWGDEIFEKFGIRPIAVINKNIFKYITKKYDLIRFENISSNSTVYALHPMMREVKSKFRGSRYVASVVSKHILAARLSLNILIPLVLSFGFGSFVYYHLDPSIASYFSAVSVVMTLAISCGIMYAVADYLNNLFVKWQAKYFHDNINGIIKKTKGKILWPNGADTRNDYDYDERTYGLIKVKLYLPPAPGNVAEVIKKISDETDVKIAADPDACKVEFINPLLEDAENKTRQYHWDKYEPIIYIESGNMVAVLAQYGDFEKEKELIDWLNNTNYKELMSFDAN